MPGSFPDHMSGINALPKWDFNVPYDPRNYGPEKQAARAAAVIERAKADKERNAKAQRELQRTMRNVAQEIRERFDAELRKAGITKDVDADEMLSIDQDSTCFASVTWEPTDDEGNGIVTGEFHRGGAKVYSAQMTREEFLEFKDEAEESGSTGGVYNVLQPF